MLLTADLLTSTGRNPLHDRLTTFHSLCKASHKLCFKL